jgi:hypothetical protein
LEQSSSAVADLFRSGRGLCHRTWDRIKELLERHGVEWRPGAWLADATPGTNNDADCR